MIAPRLFHMQPRRRARKRPRSILALSLFGLGCVGLAALARSAPLLVWNASASAPIGFYEVLPAGQIERGDMVLVRTPDDVRDLAAERAYLPLGIPLVKRVAALSGDVVCTIGDDVLIDGRTVATRLNHDRLGRPLPRWEGCRTLSSGEVFLLMADVPDSFDSRYFGPVTTAVVIGRLVPLWTE